MKSSIWDFSRTLAAFILCASAASAQIPPQPRSHVLDAASFKHFIDQFNSDDGELYHGSFPNSSVWDFLKDNIPLFDSPNSEINETYYFRWWTYRKHIERTPVGYIISEFLPHVSWAGPYNSISCAAGHHIREGRWLADPTYVDDYSRFWFIEGEPRRYSFWAADSIWSRYEVTGDSSLPIKLLPNLITNYEAWELDHRDTNGLFWQGDDRDGMEMSIGGDGYRPTINSYMFGEAKAIARIARLAHENSVADAYTARAARLRELVEEKLWDADAKFFKVLPRSNKGRLVDVREEIGFTPWYFELPHSDKSIAWRQLMDVHGFYAPFGPTTAERRSPGFRLSYEGHECQWNGPSWPYATSITLTALANLLDDFKQDAISPADYFDLLEIYTKSQRLKLSSVPAIPWIDEDLNPTNGDWIARTVLKRSGSVIPERGKDYNHSTYCDLIITGLVGLRPRADNTIEVRPLVPRDWAYFCLDRVRYHGRWLTILWDKTGDHYHRGKGLQILVDGLRIATGRSPDRLTTALPH